MDSRKGSRRNQEVRLDARIKTAEQDKTSIQERSNQINTPEIDMRVVPWTHQKSSSRLPDVEILKSVRDYAKRELEDELSTPQAPSKGDCFTGDEHPVWCISTSIFITGTFRFYGVRSTGERKTLEFAFLSSLMKLVQEKSDKQVEGLLHQVRRFRSPGRSVFRVG